MTANDLEKDVERNLLPTNESSSSLHSNDRSSDFTNACSTSSTPSFISRHIRFFTLANVLLFLLSVFLFIGRPNQKPNELNHVLKQVSSYSPILDQIEIPLIDQKVQGGLFPSSSSLLGRREPGPVTDELWQNFEIQRLFTLSREQVLALGKDPEKTSKYPNEMFGLGDEAYMGGMDIFHQLHCFNVIRKEAFKDYYWDGEKYHMEGYGPKSSPKRTHSEIWWIHFRHCTDIVLQALMCNADATMTTYTWLKTQKQPFPDFSVNKKCRDLDALVRWRDENALEVEKVNMVRKPESGDQTKVSDFYWKLYGNESQPGDNVHHPIW